MLMQRLNECMDLIIKNMRAVVGDWAEATRTFCRTEGLQNRQKKQQVAAKIHDAARQSGAACGRRQTVAVDRCRDRARSEATAA